MSPYLSKQTKHENLKLLQRTIAKLLSLLFPQLLEAFADVANVNIEKRANQGEVDRTRGKLLWPERGDFASCENLHKLRTS